MTEKKAPKKLTPEDFEAKRTELVAAVKQAEKDLWDHVHPMLENPVEVADQAFAEAKKAEKKSMKKAK